MGLFFVLVQVNRSGGALPRHTGQTQQTAARLSSSDVAQCAPIWISAA